MATPPPVRKVMMMMVGFSLKLPSNYWEETVASPFCWAGCGRGLLGHMWAWLARTYVGGAFVGKHLSRKKTQLKINHHQVDKMCN